jgi:hypothetical protein
MNINIFKKDFWTNEPITKSVLIMLLKETLTPYLSDMGLTKYNGEYIWYADFNSEGIRYVFTYTQMKGAMGLFSWGVCFENIPTYTMKKKLQYHKTDKSATLQLWDWPKGYSRSFEFDEQPGDLVSQWGERECRKTMESIFLDHRDEISAWYKNAGTIAGCTAIAKNQVEQGKSYDLHFPNPKYILSFLTARLGDKIRAEEIMTDYKKRYLNEASAWEDLFLQIEKQLESS